MAYVAKQIPEDEQNLFSRQEPTTPNPIAESGGSSGTGSGQGGPGGGAAPGMGTSTQFGSNAAKLSDYLKANKDQAEQFGQQVSGDLTNRYNEAKGDIDNAYGNFNTEVNNGWNKPDQQKVNQAATNPTQFASDPNNVSQFQGWYNNQYKGPQNFESWSPYSDVNKNVNQAVENSSLVNTSGGLGTYLNNFLGANDTTQGMRSLDTALLLGNQQSAKAIRDAASPYKNLSSYLSDKSQQANQSAGNAQQQVNQSRQDIQNRFNGQGGVIPTFGNTIQGKVDQAKSTAGQRAADAKAALRAPNINSVSDQALADMGLRRDQLDQMLQQNQFLGGSFPLANYLTQQSPDAAINAGNVSSQADYDQLAALSRLTGQDMSSILDSSQSNLAGTANMDLSEFDPKALIDLQNAYNPARAEYLKRNPDMIKTPAEKPSIGIGKPNKKPKSLGIGSPFTGVY